MLNNEGMSDALSKNFLVTEAGRQKKKMRGMRRQMKPCCWEEKLGVSG